jgi:peptidase C10-like protein
LVELEREDLIAEINARGMRDDYQPGQVLMSSCWHQFDPYYVQCPTASGVCNEPHCPVGCVATAGAQIMRYWSWPPGRDWPNMPDTLEVTDPQAEIDAVADLSHDVGLEVDMEYCSSDDHCASSADTYDMEEVFQVFGYDLSCEVIYREDYDWGDWFDYIIGEVSDNRPTQYRVVGHSIVCDGYRWNPEPQYHMNYGWANNAANIWYVLDNLNQPSEDGTWEDEYMVLGIRPNCALGSLLMYVYSCPYAPPFYRYVDRDAIGMSATFSAGQYIQFLPRMKISCTSGYVRFLSSAFESRLICYDVTKGIKLTRNGELKLNPGGEVRIDAPLRP